MTHVALRISASSGARLLVANFAPCVLDLLGHARPRSHMAVDSPTFEWQRSGAGLPYQG
jgi:hypothetical protein